MTFGSCAHLLAACRAAMVSPWSSTVMCSQMPITSFMSCSMSRMPSENCVAQLADQHHQVRLLPGVHPRRGLVEQQHLGPRAQRAGDLQPALLAVGQVARLLVAAVRQAHHLEQLLGALGESSLLAHGSRA